MSTNPANGNYDDLSSYIYGQNASNGSGVMSTFDAGSRSHHHNQYHPVATAAKTMAGATYANQRVNASVYANSNSNNINNNPSSNQDGPS